MSIYNVIYTGCDLFLAKNVIYTHRYIYSFGFIKFLTKNVFGTTVLFLPSVFQFKSIIWKEKSTPPVRDPKIDGIAVIAPF